MAPKPLLIIFAGLPGVGKTTIAREVARELGAVYLRADTIEQAMREYGLDGDSIGGMGYVVGYRVASENLELGRIVIADSVNPWQLTRDEWRNAATSVGAGYLDVEIVCRDADEHRRRVETRQPDIEAFVLPTWEQAIGRDYHDWDIEPLRIDTAERSVSDAVDMIKKRAAHVGGSNSR